MLPLERRHEIVRLLNERQKVDVNQLASELGVSAATVRRDLELLEREGLLRRTHGGAVSGDLVPGEVPLRERVGLAAAVKSRIGEEAAALIRPGETVIFSSGTTTAEVARHLRGTPNLTVVTNAVNVGLELAGAPGVQVILTGGQLRLASWALHGSLADRLFDEIYADTLILGVDGLTLAGGLMTHNLQEAQTHQAMVRAARRVIVVTDGTKLGRTAFARIAPVSVIDVLVTDRMADPDTVAGLRESGCDVIQVEEKEEM